MVLKGISFVQFLPNNRNSPGCFVRANFEQILGFQWLLLFVIVVSCGCLGLNFNDYVVLNSGHKLPLRGFGTSNLKAKPFQVKEAVYQALQIGYR